MGRSLGAESDLYRAEPSTSTRKKYYVLEMLPYPSGKLHMGHVRNYAIGDALARYMWMQGYNVLHPMGWDAFGLPAENAAIQNQTPPREWTLHNIASMKVQMKRLGFGYDWSKEIATCLPEYYRWNQWFFLKFFEHGLAYRKKSKVNWCPECATVLANEQVLPNGCCWRHENTPVEQRELEQWFLRTTKYADELLQDLDTLQGWPEKVRTMQRNWIGRSEGTLIDFKLDGVAGPAGDKISVFTTRVDTIYGATSLQFAPEHPVVTDLIANDPNLLAKVEDRWPSSQGEGSRRHWRHRKAWRIHRALCAESVQRRASAHLGGELCAARLRYRRHHVGPGARRARLRVRQEVRPRHPRGDLAAPRGRRARWRAQRAGFAVHRDEQPGDQLRRVHRNALPRSDREDVEVCRGSWLRQGNGHLSLEGLGRQPPTLLGYPDPHDLLRGLRHRAGPGERPAGAAAGQCGHHAGWWIAAGQGARVRQCELSEVRRPGAPRDRHHGHLCRFVLVLLSLH